MDIDLIIKETFQQLLTEFEVRKSSFLNIIHHNIDILVKNAPEWFGDDVPQAYTDVLNSLINVTIIYFDQNRDFLRFSEQEYEVFSPERIIKEIRDDMQFLLKRDVAFSREGDVYIETSRKIFKDSCLNIFLCFAQFVTPETEFKVKIENTMSSVKIEMCFTNLSSEMPELSKLLKVFYSYYTAQKYHFRIGLDIPFSNLKKIGGIISASPKNSASGVIVSLSFPSSEFLKTVDKIRKSNEESHGDRYVGEVLVSVRDNVLEMVLRENLAEAGYSIRLLPPEKVKFDVSGGKAIILDQEVYAEINDSFFSSDNSFDTVLVIGNSDDVVIQGRNIQRVPMPFEVQDLVDIIEKRR